MKSLAALAALLLATAGATAPAFARDTFVIDNAHLLSQATIQQISAKVADFNAQTHKEVFVDTEPTVDGTPQAAAERIFAQQHINGVLIYVAKSPKTIGVVPDAASKQFFPSGTTSSIRQAIASGFNSGDYNGGVNNGVDLSLSVYRSHLSSLRTHANAPATTTTRSDSAGGFNMSWIWWLIALAVIFFIVRGIFRAMSGPRMYGGGYGPGGPGPGYGPGYGGGGFGGGGGGFWSGLLGGLGGAWLGNELFGGRREGFGQDQSTYAGVGGDQGAADASGWQSDAGQADMGNASFGGWGGGDSGGGWGDSGGGGGDFGGGGGGDSGGGGW